MIYNNNIMSACFVLYEAERWELYILERQNNGVPVTASFETKAELGVTLRQSTHHTFFSAAAIAKFLISCSTELRSIDDIDRHRDQVSRQNSPNRRYSQFSRVCLYESLLSFPNPRS